MSYFQNKVIWLTGASSGIGEALAKQLDQDNVKLVLSARSEDKLNSIRENLSRAEAMVLPLDLAQSDTFQEKVDTVINKFGQIDILINNGGISQRSTAAETDLEVERKIMEVNYFGTVALSKAVLPHMLKRRSGHIVVISSITGKFGFFLRSTYAASKHALHGYFESLRLEEEDNGIDVTLVCPGSVNTSISTNALMKDGKVNKEKDQKHEKGMSPEVCAQKILKGVASKKHEVLVGGKEINAVRIKRLFPKLFHKLIKKQKLN